VPVLLQHPAFEQISRQWVLENAFQYLKVKLIPENSPSWATVRRITA